MASSAPHRRGQQVTSRWLVKLLASGREDRGHTLCMPLYTGTRDAESGSHRAILRVTFVLQRLVTLSRSGSCPRLVGFACQDHCRRSPVRLDAGCPAYAVVLAAVFFFPRDRDMDENTYHTGGRNQEWCGPEFGFRRDLPIIQRWPFLLCMLSVHDI